MITTLDDFYEGAKQYIERFNAFGQKHSLVGMTQADHICYKCDSKESFESMRALFEHTSPYIYQSIISNRRITIVKLPRGIETVLGTINFLELSDQKPDGSQTNRFDHIEAYPTAFSYDEMVARLSAQEQVIKVERPHHTTHDIDIGDGFLFRCTHGLLIDKIKSVEMI